MSMRTLSFTQNHTIGMGTPQINRNNHNPPRDPKKRTEYWLTPKASLRNLIITPLKLFEISNNEVISTSYIHVWVLSPIQSSVGMRRVQRLGKYIHLE